MSSVVPNEGLVEVGVAAAIRGDEAGIKLVYRKCQEREQEEEVDSGQQSSLRTGREENESQPLKDWCHGGVLRGLNHGWRTRK